MHRRGSAVAWTYTHYPTWDSKLVFLWSCQIVTTCFRLCNVSGLITCFQARTLPTRKQAKLLLDRGTMAIDNFSVSLWYFTKLQYGSDSKSGFVPLSLSTPGRMTSLKLHIYGSVIAPSSGNHSTVITSSYPYHRTLWISLKYSLYTYLHTIPTRGIEKSERSNTSREIFSRFAIVPWKSS
jgi:hypothetical protein